MSKIDIIHDMLTMAAVAGEEPDSMWDIPPELSARHARCLHEVLGRHKRLHELLVLGAKRTKTKTCFHCDCINAIRE